jgi:GTP cyclohydrolase III
MRLSLWCEFQPRPEHWLSIHSARIFSAILMMSIVSEKPLNAYVHCVGALRKKGSHLATRETEFLCIRERAIKRKALKAFLFVKYPKPLQT